MICVIHCERTSWSSLPGRCVIKPMPTPNFLPSDKICFKILVETTLAPAGAKRCASSKSVKTG
ncbi:MAG: hypothetical protein WKF71_11850 [Pyrinomonadaceae bacterium]